MSAYHRAKAVDAAGKIMNKSVEKSKKHRHPSQQITKSRREEMQELFHHDMGEKKQLKRRTFGVGKKSKSSFKSKSRYASPYVCFCNSDSDYIVVFVYGTNLL